MLIRSATSYNVGCYDSPLYDNHDDWSPSISSETWLFPLFDLLLFKYSIETCWSILFPPIRLSNSNPNDVVEVCFFPVPEWFSPTFLSMEFSLSLFELDPLDFTRSSNESLLGINSIIFILTLAFRRGGGSGGSSTIYSIYVSSTGVMIRIDSYILYDSTSSMLPNWLQTASSSISTFDWVLPLLFFIPLLIALLC